ncbi:ABC transporter permease [Actinomyces lilanjuaniae]|uniref:ABC transporter permease n=1 Tax=Actinomyces lilanjuaniae TaxID=2321394 RepID=A0ABM6Z4R2_9ACTO|nr:ABC transporter permease [Actinomyces lilanjuaniae]AYD90168.1 ABC transporter permease [Actinomyces lilanjuaniae]
MRRGIMLELRKTRRLRTRPLLASLVVAVAALSCLSLFAGSTRDSLDDPQARPWAALLLTYTFMAAMTSPLLTAVLASRQTDIEHSGQGWVLAATAGHTPGTLCRAKLVTLALLLLPAVAVQSGLVVAVGVLAGIRVPLDTGSWAGYTLLLYLLDVAFCALHIWLAARVDNQLVSVGVGTLGSFLAVFSLLMPSAVSRLIPWGYYAVISHAGQEGDRVSYVSAPYGWVAGFLVLVAVVFTVVTRRLDRVER